MCLTKTEKEKKECNGGTTCCIYKIRDTVPSPDKGNHKQRSIANSPVHRKHWRKVTPKVNS